jgi:hypothetical protein
VGVSLIREFSGKYRDGGAESHDAHDQPLLDGAQDRLQHRCLDESGISPIIDHDLAEAEGVRTWLVIAMITMSLRAHGHLCHIRS